MRLFKRPHEKDFNALSLFNNKSSDIFIDIGSNRGESILSIIVSCKNIPVIHGFEPNKFIYDKLNNKFGKLPSVNLNNLGMGNKTENKTLFVPFYRKWMFDGLSSFHYEFAQGWLKNRLWRYKESNLNIKEIECNIKVLDNFELNPFFIKIDVQGYEIEVLQGAKETIFKNKPIILIESITPNIINFLSELNYKFYFFSSGKFHEGAGTLNTFCITDGKLPKT